MENNELGQGEIIIVRRGGGHGEDEHHGGVWKIAFADFMTAMMAFFLVMWLINASNEETKQALASYFNPIKLMDTTSNPKGVRNPKYGVEANDLDEEDEESTKVSAPQKKHATGETVAKAYEEQALFVDPFSLLSEIEAGINVKEESAVSMDNSSSARDRGMSLNGGISFQDPFDPALWNIREGEVAKPGETGDGADQGTDSLREKIGANVEEASESKTAPPEKAPEAMPTTEDPPAGETREDFSEEARSLAEKLGDQVKELKQEMEVAGLDVDVELSNKGALVVLSDKSQNGMFNIGSARPTPELVKIMSSIGEAVARHGGPVEIRGHTDGRKYQSGDYDNWRLSTARAHMAYYMLVRGGMQESQVEMIIGQADVNLKVPDDPYSPANRRIEVLLRVR